MNEIPSFRISEFFLKEILNISRVIARGNNLAFKLNKQGLHFKMVDVARMAMMEFSIPATKDVLKIIGDSELMFGLDAQKTLRFLSNAKSQDDVVHVSFDKTTRSKADDANARVDEYTPTLKLRNMRYRQKYIVPYNFTDPNITDLAFPFTCFVYRDSIIDAIKFISNLSDHVVFIMTKDEVHESLVLTIQEDKDYKVEFEAKADIQSIDVSIPQKGLPPKTEGKARSLYPLDYLTAFLKQVKFDLLKIEMANDYLLKISARFKYGEGEVKYYLAPRIENV